MEKSDHDRLVRIEALQETILKRLDSQDRAWWGIIVAVIGTAIISALSFLGKSPL